MIKGTKGIDFLKPLKKGDFKKTETLRLLRIGSIVLVIFYCLFVGATLSFWVYLQKESRDISSQIASKKERIEELRKIESLQTVLKQRLSSLNKVFSKKRINYPQVLSYLKEVSLEDVSLKELDLSEGGEVSLTGSAPNASALSNFFERLSSASPLSPFPEIILSSLSRRKDGSYNFSLTLKSYEES